MTKTAARHPSTSPPRWVILLGVALVVVVMLFVALHLSGVMPMGHSM